MIGGGIATPPGTAKTVAAINNEMVVDSVGSGSVSGSASGSGSPATGSTRTNNNKNNNDTSNNNNNEGHVIILGSSTAPVTTNTASSGGKICCQDDDPSPGTGTTVTRPWEPPSPTLAQSRARLLQIHPSHHHSQHPNHPHHHQRQIVQPAGIIEGETSL